MHASGVLFQVCTARRRPTSGTLPNNRRTGVDLGRPGQPLWPSSGPDRPFRLPPTAFQDDGGGTPAPTVLTAVSPARYALLSGLFPVAPDALGAMLAAEPKLRDLPITDITQALMELRRRLPHSNLETIVSYAPRILFQDPDTVADALKKLRAFLPEPLLEFLVQEEQALLAGGLSPRRLNELREAWDQYGGAFEVYRGKDEQLREDLLSSRLAQYVRHTLVDFYH